MFAIKKCAQCGGNSFKLLFDNIASVACEACGQVYNQAVFKRLPNDTEALKRLTINVATNTKLIGN